MVQGTLRPRLQIHPAAAKANTQRLISPVAVTVNRAGGPDAGHWVVFQRMCLLSESQTSSGLLLCNAIFGDPQLNATGSVHSSGGVSGWSSVLVADCEFGGSDGIGGGWSWRMECSER